ncbi:MAG: hypothetical protein AAFZ80_13270 [Cyanobacteria bacterium P01_A01_bin.105]
MFFVYYGLPAIVVFFVALDAFVRDTEAPKNRPFDWAFIVIAALLWPITGPFIVWKKVTRLWAKPQKPLPAQPHLSKGQTSVDQASSRSHPISTVESISRR